MAGKFPIFSSEVNCGCNAALYLVSMGYSEKARKKTEGKLGATAGLQSMVLLATLVVNILTITHM
jgi:hypothetical protein